MGIFSKEKKEKELVLVFDIGSSSVGGAVFEVQKFKTPKIILSIREPIVFESKIDTSRFFSLTLKSIEIVASRVCMSGVGRLSKIFCVLSSPWYASQVRTIKLEKNTPFIFTSKLADELIKKEISLFEEENLTKFPDTGDKVRMIEFKNMKTILNGYPTPDPLNKKTKKLEIMVFVSMSGEDMLRKIENSIAKHFHTSEIKFSTFVMTSFAVVRDMFIKQEDFILVDISGEVTDISIIKKDILSNSISYPLGRNFLIRKVAESLDCTLSEAKSLVSLYKDKHATKSLDKKLAQIIDKLKMDWLKCFQESLINISDDISIPPTIFITVDPDFINFFQEIIHNEQFNQYTLIESKFKIIFLNAQIFHRITSFKEDIERDAFLMIESIYINRFIY